MWYETSHNSLKREDIDWSQSRIIFIAPEFTKHQYLAIGFKDLAIQLYKVRKYKSGLMVFNEIKPLDKKESIATITKGNPDARTVSQEIVVYTEEDFLKTADDQVKLIYSELKSAINNLGTDIEIRPIKKYISFRRNKALVGIIFLYHMIHGFLVVNCFYLIFYLCIFF